jgi:hypothetical protein
VDSDLPAIYIDQSEKPVDSNVKAALHQVAGKVHGRLRTARFG